MSAQVEQSLEVIVLAAGKGTRMYSDLPKVLHELAGEPLLAHVLRCVKQLSPRAVHVVYGHGAEAVRSRFQSEKVNWILQSEQQGTGHAVKTALPSLHPDSKALIVYGDVPLADPVELSALTEAADAGKPALLTAKLDNPNGYGRVIRMENGSVRRIVEQKDAGSAELCITEVNTGFVAAKVSDLARWLERVDNCNAQKEYYLTDLIAVAANEGCAIADKQVLDAATVQGVNSKTDLALLERYYQRKRAGTYLQQGVTIIDPGRLDVRGEVVFGCDCVVDVNVVLQGPLQFGDGVYIEANSIIRRSTIGDHVHIKPHCVIEGAAIGPKAIIGPFARIRPGTKTADDVHIGNFVEVKNSALGSGTKVNHLSYVGDSTVGSGVNIGAGVITCNYDGKHKHQTQIGDNVFVGSDSQLIAPVKLGDGAIVGAGSTITHDVPADTLALGRAKQKLVKSRRRPQKKDSG